MKLETIPPSIIDANRERGHTDAAIEAMSAVELFDEYCNWHGLIRWGGNLFWLAVDLRAAEVKEGSPVATDSVAG